MKMYLPFGDWSDDGHGRYEKILIEAPSMEHLLNAQNKIKEIYGASFFSGMAECYQEPYFTETVWKALKNTNYPIERIIKYDYYNDWNGIKSIDQMLEEDPNPYLSLDLVADAFIWLLNCYGAEIVQVEEEHLIPTICNWTCNGFETVGYGCF